MMKFVAPRGRSAVVQVRRTKRIKRKTVQDTDTPWSHMISANNYPSVVQAVAASTGQDVLVVSDCVLGGDCKRPDVTLVLLSPATVTVNADAELQCPINAANGGRFSVAAGATLSLAPTVGPIAEPTHRLFAGAGVTRWLPGQPPKCEIHQSWFGGPEKTLASIETTGADRIGGRVMLQQERTLSPAGLVLSRSCATVRGAGAYQGGTRYQAKAGAGCWKLVGCCEATLAEMMLWGSGTGGSPITSTYGVTLTQGSGQNATSTRCKLDTLRIWRFKDGVRTSGPEGNNDHHELERVRIIECDNAIKIDRTTATRWKTRNLKVEFCNNVLLLDDCSSSLELQSTMVTWTDCVIMMADGYQKYREVTVDGFNAEYLGRLCELRGEARVWFRGVNIVGFKGNDPTVIDMGRGNLFQIVEVDSAKWALRPEYTGHLHVRVQASIDNDRLFRWRGSTGQKIEVHLYDRFGVEVHNAGTDPDLQINGGPPWGEMNLRVTPSATGADYVCERWS